MGLKCRSLLLLAESDDLVVYPPPAAAARLAALARLLVAEFQRFLTAFSDL